MGLPLNNVNCDIYIGIGAGKKLLADINAAQQEVKIVSPYLSGELIKTLISLSKRNIAIKLITMDRIDEGFNKEIIRELIQQERHVDNTAVLLRDKYKNAIEWLLYVLLGLVVLFVLSCTIWTEYGYKMLLGIVPIITIFSIRKMYEFQYQNTRIYTYSYKRLFDFKVFNSNSIPYVKGSTYFIHSKMYVIDSKIAYLGSLNFTKNGTENSYESRIRITDWAAVSQISCEIDSLYMNNYLTARDINDWGREIYWEPRN